MGPVSQSETCIRDFGVLQQLKPHTAPAEEILPATEDSLLPRAAKCRRPSGRCREPERERCESNAQPANLSVAATRARLFGGSKALWPLSGVMMRSASGHARWSAHALSMGQTTS